MMKKGNIRSVGVVSFPSPVSCSEVLFAPREQTDESVNATDSISYAKTTTADATRRDGNSYGNDYIPTNTKHFGGKSQRKTQGNAKLFHMFPVPAALSPPFWMKRFFPVAVRCHTLIGFDEVSSQQ